MVSKSNQTIKDFCSYDANFYYTKADLDKPVNKTETLREYIFDTENSFELEHEDVDNMSDEQLNNYVRQLDELW